MISLARRDIVGDNEEEGVREMALGEPGRRRWGKIMKNHLAKEIRLYCTASREVES